MGSAMAVHTGLPAVRPTNAPTSQEIRFCRASDGVRLAWAIHGSGPPLVVVSCWLSHLQYDWQSPVWRHFLEDLGVIATVVRYDERGFGMSDWSVEDFSLEARVDDLEAIIAATGLERFALLGMSGGSARRDGLCDRPPGAGQSADPLRHRLRRARQLVGRRMGRGADLPEHDPGRLGQGGRGLPARVHEAVHPRRVRRADALVRRPPADVDVARQRRGQPDRPPAGRHRGRAAADQLPDDRAPGTRRPVDDVRQCRERVVADQGCPPRPAPESATTSSWRTSRPGVSSSTRCRRSSSRSVGPTPSGRPTGPPRRCRPVSSMSSGWLPTAGRTMRSRWLCP